MSLSKEIKDAGNKYGFLIQTSDPYHFYPIQTAFGGYIFGKNADGSYNAKDIGLNSEGSVAAFDWLNSMYDQGLLDRGSNIDGGLLAVGLPEWRCRHDHQRPVEPAGLP